MSVSDLLTNANESYNWQKWPYFARWKNYGLVHTSIHKLGRMYVTAAHDVHKRSFILSCETAEDWWICFFLYLFTNRCMESWNATWNSLWGETIFRVRALYLTVPLWSGRVRRSRVRALILSPCRPLVWRTPGGPWGNCRGFVSLPLTN